MQKNLSNYKINNNVDKLAISQYFEDIKYSCIPKSKYQYKSFIIFGYDIILDRTVLCVFTLIMDEIEETFNYLFNKLKLLYNFKPQIITCDYQLSLRLSLKNIFPEVKIHVIIIL